MNIIILTSSLKGIASRVLPELCKNENINIAGVVLANGTAPFGKRKLLIKCKKLLKIGLLGSLNGIRMRSWYEDSDTEDISILCKRFKIKLLRTPFINCDITKQFFAKAKPDLGISLNNGYIPKSVYTLPKFGMINLHMELLPEFQGAQGIIWPIFKSKTLTGFTIHQINNKIDSGKILYQEMHPIFFANSLKATIRLTTIKMSESNIPRALSYVVENYESLRDSATLQPNNAQYTTPSIWQYLKIYRNYKKLARKACDI